VLPAVVIAVWQAVAALGWVNPQMLPSPLAVAEKAGLPAAAAAL
jgi:NitT/TauT family transport system permease protein